VVDHGRVIATGSPEELKAKTGSQTLAVRPADAERLGEVVAIVEAVTGQRAETQSTTVSAPVLDPRALGEALRRLESAGITVGEIALRDSSLDEVFLSLTGHAAEDTTTVGEDAR
jgi:oleandomycin transport system ATP-binding protein